MTEPSADDTPYELDDRPVSAGGVSVRTVGAALLAAREPVLAEAVADGVPGALVAKDPTLWGPEAAPEASVRLGWLDLPQSSRELLPRLASLRDELQAEGLDHVVLSGMGGSSLAPEVILRTAGLDATILDTTDPQQVRAAIADRLERTVLVVASKSGGTVETDSHRRAYEKAFTDAGIDAASRIVVVTDPGSPLERTAKDAGYRAVFLADPDVGGRYSALSAFGLVPTALAGADVEALLDEAAALAPSLAQEHDNPGLALGAVLGGGGLAGRDKVVLADAGSGILGFGDWAEQLVAESTGKDGRGLLPVVVESPDAPGTTLSADGHLVLLGDKPHVDDATQATLVSGPLGAQFLLWEYATAVAGRVLRINPFDQPNVTESKDNTNAILAEPGLLEATPLLTDEAIEVYGDTEAFGGVTDVAGALDALLAELPPRGYLAVLAYLGYTQDSAAVELRPALARRVPQPVTFGWGPRFLHSTGQFHKGGPQVGVFLQITGAVGTDLDVPGRDFTFGQLQAAQARGDWRALVERGRPALRLHLLDRADGLRQLLRAAGRSAG